MAAPPLPLLPPPTPPPPPPPLPPLPGFLPGPGGFGGLPPSPPGDLGVGAPPLGLILGGLMMVVLHLLQVLILLGLMGVEPLLVGGLVEVPLCLQGQLLVGLLD